MNILKTEPISQQNILENFFIHLKDKIKIKFNYFN
jgi:hypothetical protein